MDLTTVDNPNISQWLSRKNYTYVSKDIQNEIARLMAHKIMRDITSNLHQAEFYSILADETTDVSNKEQLVSVFRWVGSNFDVHEEYLGLYQLDKTDAETIYLVIKDMLQALNLDIQRLEGNAMTELVQCQDPKKGWQRGLKRKSLALYTCIVLGTH